MPVKMRLARFGRKRYAYYHIVIADSRAPRDGRYIERIGSYNPNSNPATIDLDFDKAFDWLTKGAQPTDTVRAILSYKGVLYKKHLMGGVKKGAFDEAEAEKRLDNWMAEKDAKIQAKIDRLAGDADAEFKKQLAAEAKVNEAKKEAIAARNAELQAEADAKKAAKKAEQEAEQAAKDAEAAEAQAAKDAVARAEAQAAKEAKEAEAAKAKALKEAQAADAKAAKEAEAAKAKAAKEAKDAEAVKTEKVADASEAKTETKAETEKVKTEEKAEEKAPKAEGAE